jgi:hypothetical protein
MGQSRMMMEMMAVLLKPLLCRGVGACYLAAG